MGGYIRPLCNGNSDGVGDLSKRSSGVGEGYGYFLELHNIGHHFCCTLSRHTGKNNWFPFLDILGYLKNTHKSPKFGRVRQVPIRELGWEFPGWDLSHFAKFGIFMGIL